jgi:spermidine synthase
LGYQSAWPSSGILTGGVWDYLALTPVLSGSSAPELRVLIVGLAAGTVARQIQLAFSPTRSVILHGIELDPAVIEAGHRYFGLGSIPGLTIETRGARVAVEPLEASFDVIVVDAYRGLYLPAHLATEEFFESCERRLAPGGVLAINVVNPLDSGRLLGAIGTTLEQVFGEVRYLQLPANGPVASTILFASQSPLEMPARERIPEALRPVEFDLRQLDLPPEHRRVLTDDWAPVEWLTDLALLEALR